MQDENFFLADELVTIDFGKILAAAILSSETASSPTGSGAFIIYLQGDLGTGKTTLSRGVLRGMGHAGAVKSPTYTLVEPYELQQGNVYHFDLYRLSDPEEVEYLGVEEYFSTGNICLIEWPEQGEKFLPAADIYLRLKEQRGLANGTAEASTTLLASVAEDQNNADASGAEKVQVRGRGLQIEARSVRGEQVLSRLIASSSQLKHSP